MKMYLISDNIDTWTGMRLAGVDGAVVHERDELKRELDKVLADKSIGIILLTEKFGREFPEIIDNVKLERKLPLSWRALSVCVRHPVRLTRQRRQIPQSDPARLRPWRRTTRIRRKRSRPLPF